MSISFNEAEDSNHTNWTRFLGQTLCVPAIAEGLAFLIFLLGALVTNNPPEGEVLWTALTIAAFGFLGGATLPRFFGTLIQSGRWIWLPFLALALAGVFSDIHTLSRVTHESRSAVFAMWLYDTGSDEGGRIMLVTYPLYATVSYSIAICIFAKSGKG